MKSNICRIDKGTKDLAAILSESEKVAVYNGLDHKETMQLRLLCEEIDGMLPNIMDDFVGELWFDFEDGVCRVNASLTLEEMTANKKEELLSIAKDKKNAAASGVVGKIRSFIEDFFLDEVNQIALTVTPAHYPLAAGYSDGVDYAYLWSLSQYRDLVKQEAQEEDWDELEKSVIASIADDVTVSVKGKRVDIVVIKKFA